MKGQTETETKKPFNDSYLPMITPTRDNTMDDQLTLSFITISQLLKKEYVRVTSTASSIHIARTEAFGLLKRSLRQMGYDTKGVRGMLVDSDIRWDSSENEKIAEEIRRADREKYNFVIPYRIRDTTSILSVTVGSEPKSYHRVPITTYFTEWENYRECTVCGLGFYYGDLPLDYNFHFSNYGEDMNFFLDNNLTPKVLNNINIFHVKKMLLGLKEIRYL